MAKGSGTSVTPIALQGGLNLAATPMNMQSGEARVLHNYRTDSMGRYERVTGYERYDGRPEPSKQSFVVLKVEQAPDNWSPGDTVNADQGEGIGTALYYDEKEKRLIVIDVQGQFHRHDILSPTGWGPVKDVFYDHSGSGILVTQDYRKRVADYYREKIEAVPGFGPIRGVAFFYGRAYAWRDSVRENAEEVETVMWGSSPEGWVPVDVLPPRIYEPPYQYQALIYAAEAGAGSLYRSGYFRAALHYGKVLYVGTVDDSLHGKRMDKDRVEEIWWGHTSDGNTKIVFDLGYDLGEPWELQVYVEDILTYRFDTLMQPAVVFKRADDSNTRYEIILDDAYELWGGGQTVGFIFRDVAYRPDPNGHQWEIEAPAEVAEGQTLEITVKAKRAVNNLPFAAPFRWRLSGIQESDLDDSAGDLATLEGEVVMNGATGEHVLSFLPTVDGYSENESMTIEVIGLDESEQPPTTPTVKLQKTVKLLDTQLDQGTHSYVLLGLHNITEGDTSTYTIRVTNKVGERVEGQQVFWDLVTDMDEDFFSMPLLGDIVTDENGQGTFELMVNPGSIFSPETFTLRLWLPGADTQNDAPLQSYEVTVNPYETPSDVKLIKGPDVAGFHWGYRMTPSDSVSKSQPVKIEVFSFASVNRNVVPGVKFNIKVQFYRTDAGGSSPARGYVVSGATDQYGRAETTVVLKPEEAKWTSFMAYWVVGSSRTMRRFWSGTSVEVHVTGGPQPAKDRQIPLRVDMDPKPDR